MKTILVAAYAMNPYSESVDGRDWDFALQIARFNHVIAVTRTCNMNLINTYINEHPGKKELFGRISVLYFDWPYLLRFWNKGQLLSMIYFRAWQFTVAIWLFLKKPQIDIVHDLMLHKDWIPSFLWILNKPMLCGPVEHHPKIPKNFLKSVYGKKEFYKNRIAWIIKQFCRKTDPFLLLTTCRATILHSNSLPRKKLKFKKRGYIVVPSVASDIIPIKAFTEHDGFTILSTGDFIPYNGFDLAIRSFSIFFHQLSNEQQTKIKLILAGSGPQMDRLHKIILEEKISHCTEIIENLSEQQLEKLYGSAHVFLFPSHEADGLAAVKAMSYGVPVVCLDQTAPGEFLHPISELKVNYTNYDETLRKLADKLCSLYHVTNYYRSEEKLALSRFNKYFRWDVRGEQLKVIYESILKEDFASEVKEIISKLSKVSR